MFRRVTSPGLVGRHEELSAIRAAALAAANGDGRIVLVAGDAGIGKTRLVDAACAWAVQDGLGAVIGGCVQLGEVPLAYAPVLEVVRGVRDKLGEERFADVVPPTLTGLLSGEQAVSSSRLFAHVLDFLVGLGRLCPWLIVFEDLHWADASTRDLLAFLARNLRRAAVTLVLTYRSDELHRRHPLRPLLADLERAAGTERIALAGLGRADLIELLAGLGLGDMDEAEVSALLARSGGNPLYVEELVAAAPPASVLHTPLPATLSEVILTRVGQLSAACQSVLRQAAVLGTDVDDRLLSACCDLPNEQITEALREAVGAQLLVLDGGGCRFRHALLAEALDEDLLPGERQRIHVAAARALEAGEHAPDLPEHMRWALLAHHWDAAHDLSRAFIASLRAGDAQVRVHAHSAAAGHFERALELWDQVPDATGKAGMDRASLLLRAAEAVHFSSRSPRQLALINAAYEALDDAEPERRAVILERAGHMHWDLRRAAEATAAYERAVQVLADRPPSPERAFALAALGQSLMLRQRHRDAETTLLEAIACAEPIGAHRAEAHARSSLGVVQAELGRAEAAVVTARHALQLSLAHGTSSHIARCHANLAAVLLLAGKHEEVGRAVTEGLAYYAQAGQLDQYGDAITAVHVAALINAGRWPEAVRVDAELRSRLTDAGDRSYADHLTARRVLSQLWAGDYEAATPEVDRLLRATADNTTPHLRGVVLFRAGELAWGQRRWDDARTMFEAGLRVCDTGDGQFYVAYGLASALMVEADRVESAYGSGPQVHADVAQAQAVADRLALRVTALRDRVGDSIQALLPEPAGWLAVADAEHARVRRVDTSEQWLAIADHWEAMGMPYPAAVARWRAASATLRAGTGRASAAEYAAQALRVAGSLGAARLANEIRLLERRGRLDLDRAGTPQPQPRPDPLAKLGVTPREAEVLEFLAAGRTNRQIAGALFISEKTASVHVSNLLRKLGVTNRIDAAAIAQRMGHDSG